MQIILEKSDILIYECQRDKREVAAFADKTILDGRGKEFVMPKYDIYVSCPQCRGEHPMGVGIYLDSGPQGKQSIHATYGGKVLPPQVLAIQRHKCVCSKTGKRFTQEDSSQVFLVPYSAFGRRPTSVA